MPVEPLFTNKYPNFRNIVATPSDVVHGAQVRSSNGSSGRETPSDAGTPPPTRRAWRSVESSPTHSVVDGSVPAPPPEGEEGPQASPAAVTEALQEESAEQTE